jgi:membrane protein DedA with SNARE-associated domain
MRAGPAGIGGLAALALLLPMEAGVPIPLPADLVMFTVGERVAAGRFPLWLAVAGFEVVAAVGTVVLFVACRGSAGRLVARYGPRLGLSEARIHRVAAVAETRGLAGLAVGRATPGLRTLTVVAAGVSGLSGRRALPALILGSSVFLQVHLILGLLLGPLADRAFDQAKVPALAVAAALAAAALLFWRGRRRNRLPAAWTEAACPACLAVRAVAERVPRLAEMAASDAADSGPNDQPKALAS